MTSRTSLARISCLASLLLAACGGSSNPDGSDGGTDQLGGNGGGGAGGSSRDGAGGGDTGGGDTGGPGTDGGGDAPTDEAAVTIARTIAFHELTNATSMPKGITGQPVISADGSKIAFAYAPGTKDPSNPQRIYTINPDGSGLIEVDTYTSRWYATAMVAISADGKTVVSSTNYEVRVVGSIGGKEAEADFTSYEISDIAISGDGRTVFMTHRRDNSMLATGMPIERGVYALDTATGALTKLVNATDLAAVTGAMPSDVFPFDTCGPSLAVSQDGSRVAFSAVVGGKGPVVGALAGAGGPKVLIGPIEGAYTDVYSIDVSGDGSKVLYQLKEKDGVGEFGTIGLDGAGRKAILMGTEPKDFGGTCSSPRLISRDGSQALLGDWSQVYPTAGGDPWFVQFVTEGQDVGGPPLGGACCDTAPNTHMNNDATRFTFVSLDDMGLRQVALAQVDPTSLDGAPTLGPVTITPASLSRMAPGGSAIVTAKISGGGTVKNAGTSWRYKDSEEVGGRVLLHDDGKAPDVAAGDGTYSGVGLSPASDAMVGPRVVRIKAESKGADGRRHATAVDVAGVEVK